MNRLFKTEMGSRNDRITAFCGLTPILLGVAALLGWVVGFLPLARILPHYIPMAPDTALLFVICGLTLLSGAYNLPSGKKRVCLGLLLGATALCGLMEFTKLFVPFDFDSVWVRDFVRKVAPNISNLNPHMSPFSGALFLTASISILVKIFGDNRSRSINTSSLLGMIVTLAGFIATLGYVFGTPFLYGGDTIPLAATTSVGFLMLGCGLTAMTRTDSVFMRPFIGDNAVARLLRGILPIVVIIILAHGVIGGIIVKKFAINQALFSALLTLLFMLITGLMVIHLARSIFRKADNADIERRKAENELHRSRQMLQAILNGIPQRVFCKDRESSYLWCNKAFANDAGLAEPDEIIGMNDFQLPWKDNAELYRSDDQKVMGSGAPRLHYVEPLTWADDEKGWIQTSKTPLRESDGNIFGVLGSFEDITPRIAAEDELRRAKDQAEAANRAKDEFLSTISHELLTPLNGILGFSELINAIMPKKDVPHIEEIQNDLQSIHECGETLLGIINDVLELSRIEAGQFESVKNEFSPVKLITSTIAMFKLSANNKHLELDFIPLDLPGILVGDNCRLKQILFNLIGNAVKFTEQGKVEVTAACREDGILTVTVKDTGIGIPPDKQKLIMLPFVQADQSTTRKYSGAGLGLTVVSRMLKMLGGTIELESELGRGSTFTVKFPAEKGTLQADGSVADQI